MGSKEIIMLRTVSSFVWPENRSWSTKIGEHLRLSVGTRLLRWPRLSFLDVMRKPVSNFVVLRWCLPPSCFGDTKGSLKSWELYPRRASGFSMLKKKLGQ